MSILPQFRFNVRAPTECRTLTFAQPTHVVVSGSQGNEGEPADGARIIGDLYVSPHVTDTVLVPSIAVAAHPAAPTTDEAELLLPRAYMAISNLIEFRIAEDCSKYEKQTGTSPVCVTLVVRTPPTFLAAQTDDNSSSGISVWTDVGWIVSGLPPIGNGVWRNAGRFLVSGDVSNVVLDWSE